MSKTDSSYQADPAVAVWHRAALGMAREAGALIIELAAGRPEVRHKGPIDIVTSADLRSEELIREKISSLFPDHGILAEEGGGIEDSDILWVIDPIDGTTNYAHGFPVFAVSIGIMLNGEPVAGVVYDPNLKEMFSAVKGRGATLNGRPIAVSSVDDLDSALLATGFPYSLREAPEPILADFSRILLKCQGVRRAGAATIDLCNLACGRIDAFWERGLKPWDTAAAGLIVTESGGTLSKYDDSDFDHFFPQMAASNGLLHKKLLKLLAG